MSRITNTLLLLLVASTNAFTLNSSSSGRQQSTSLSAVSSRRAWLDSAAVAAAASFVLPAFAEDAVDDLAMPTEEEQKAADAAAMEAKLRKKAELQKASGKPMGFKENMEAEKRKQDSLKKSKEERRNALCEELGRGC